MWINYSPYKHTVELCYITEVHNRVKLSERTYLYSFLTKETEQCADASATLRTVSGNISVKPHSLSISVSSNCQRGKQMGQQYITGLRGQYQARRRHQSQFDQKNAVVVV